MLARGDGSLLAHSAERLVRRDARGLVTPIPLPATRDWMRLVGAHLLVREPSGAFSARAVGRRGLEPALELGTTSITSPTLDGCRTDSHTFAFVHERNARAPASLIVIGRDRARLWELPALRWRLSCAGETAVLLGLERRSGSGPLQAVQTTCTSQACQSVRSNVHSELALDPMDGEDTVADIARVGEQVAVVWRADGVRVKLAPIAALASAPAQVIVDDRPEKSAAAERVHRLRLDSLGSSALLLLDAARGSFGFLLTPGGVLPLAGE